MAGKQIHGFSVIDVVSVGNSLIVAATHNQQRKLTRQVFRIVAAGGKMKSSDSI